MSSKLENLTPRPGTIIGDPEDIVHTNWSAKEMKKELRQLKRRKIDLSDPDAPEILDWSKAVRAKFYRPVTLLADPEGK